MTEAKINSATILTKNKSEVTTEAFWDGVASVYSGSDLTTHMQGFELGIIESEIKDKDIHILGSFGAADGNRDPISILNFLNESGLRLPKHVVVNDISNNMVQEAKKNLEKKCWHEKIAKIDYIYSPVANIDLAKHRIYIPDHKIILCVGVYSANYIMESLALYRQEKKVIGDEFILYPLYFKDSVIIKGESIQFHIDRYEEKTDLILSMKKTDNFYAYGVITNYNFVSHYFDADMLNKILKLNFPTYSVDTITGDMSDNRRYIVNIIKSNSGHNTCVITMLNNVFGNIKMEEQLSSLRILSSFITNSPAISSNGLIMGN